MNIHKHLCVQCWRGVVYFVIAFLYICDKYVHVETKGYDVPRLYSSESYYMTILRTCMIYIHTYANKHVCSAGGRTNSS